MIWLLVPVQCICTPAVCRIVARNSFKFAKIVKCDKNPQWIANKIVFDRWKRFIFSTIIFELLYRRLSFDGAHIFRHFLFCTLFLSRSVCVFFSTICIEHTVACNARYLVGYNTHTHTGVLTSNLRACVRNCSKSIDNSLCMRRCSDRRINARYGYQHSVLLQLQQNKKRDCPPNQPDTTNSNNHNSAIEVFIWLGNCVL